MSKEKKTFVEEKFSYFYSKDKDGETYEAGGYYNIDSQINLHPSYSFGANFNLAELIATIKKKIYISEKFNKFRFENTQDNTIYNDKNYLINNNFIIIGAGPVKKSFNIIAKLNLVDGNISYLVTEESDEGVIFHLAAFDIDNNLTIFTLNELGQELAHEINEEIALGQLPLQNQKETNINNFIFNDEIIDPSKLDFILRKFIIKSNEKYNLDNITKQSKNYANAYKLDNNMLIINTATNYKIFHIKAKITFANGEEFYLVANENLAGTIFHLAGFDHNNNLEIFELNEHGQALGQELQINIMHANHNSFWMDAEIILFEGDTEDEYIQTNEELDVHFNTNETNIYQEVPKEINLEDDSTNNIDGPNLAAIALLGLSISLGSFDKI